MDLGKKLSEQSRVLAPCGLRDRATVSDLHSDGRFMTVANVVHHGIDHKVSVGGSGRGEYFSCGQVSPIVFRENSVILNPAMSGSNRKSHVGPAGRPDLDGFASVYRLKSPPCEFMHAFGV